MIALILVSFGYCLRYIILASRSRGQNQKLDYLADGFSRIGFILDALINDMNTNRGLFLFP
jgi:hypothetical protein